MWIKFLILSNKESFAKKPIKTQYLDTSTRNRSKPDWSLFQEFLYLAQTWFSTDGTKDILVFALQVSSPNEVELWEAVLTFICFPLLVVGAYIIDKEFCGKKEHEQDMELGLGKISKKILEVCSFKTE